MLIVDKFIVYSIGRCDDIDRCHAQNPFSKGYTAVDATVFWNKYFNILKKLEPSLSFYDLDEINDIYYEWVDASVSIGVV